MDWKKLNPYKNEKGSRDRFYDKTGIAKHREWRGLEDTWYDFTQWLVNLGIMGAFVAQTPLRIIRGMLEDRSLGSHLAPPHSMATRTEGTRGRALRRPPVPRRPRGRWARCPLGPRLPTCPAN